MLEWVIYIVLGLFVLYVATGLVLGLLDREGHLINGYPELVKQWIRRAMVYLGLKQGL